MSEGERAFRYTVTAFGLAVVIPLAFALRLPASPVQLVAVAVPMAFVALTWIALHRKCSRGGARPGRIAWALVIVFPVACVFLVSFGGFHWLPAAYLLTMAAAITPSATTA